MRVVCFCFVLLLSACGPPGPFTSTDVHSRLTTHASKTYHRRLNAISTVQAFAYAVTNGQQTTLGVKTFVMRSDLNYPKIAQAQSFGHTLAYEKDDRRRAGNLRIEAGHISMDARAFLTAARQGLVFQLSGPRGSYPVMIPPHSFSEVLRRLDESVWISMCAEPRVC